MRLWRRRRDVSAIYRRKDGRWSTCVSIRGKQRHLYGKTPEEVAAKRDEFLNAQPAALATANQTVAEYLTTWLETVVTIRNKASTQKSYSDMVRLHIAPAIGHYRLRSLSPEHVQTLLNDLHRAGLAARTVRYARSILHRALNHALKRGYVARNVADLTDAPRVTKYRATALSEEQIRAFFVEIRGHRLEPLYWLALLGLRRGELLALTWQDVNLGKGTIRVSEGKTDSSIRTLPLSPTLIHVLESHRERILKREARVRSQDLVFPSAAGTPLSPRNLLRHFKSALKRAGLPPIRFHDLRHTSATLFLENGKHPKTVQAILGHSQVGITMDIYSHVSLSEQDDAVQSLEKLFARLTW